jgi:hypothetical protein
MTIKRDVMKFLIPTSIFGIKSDSLAGRKVIPLYIGPESFKINETKIIKETLTKGGFIVEYWGEQLPVISVTGGTGSGGILAIEILRSIYRNEQIQMEQLLLLRAREAEADSQFGLRNTDNATVRAGVRLAFDALFENGLSEIQSGIKTTIDRIGEIFDQSVEENTNPIELIPSLGAYAVSVDLYFQGLKYRGFFTNFNVNESATEPGLFTYDFSFKVLKRSGKRSNFMPWHRNPFDENGEARTASIPIEGARVDELSYAATYNLNNSAIAGEPTSTFSQAESPLQLDENDVGISRLNKVRS